MVLNNNAVTEKVEITNMSKLERLKKIFGKGHDCIRCLKKVDNRIYVTDFVLAEDELRVEEYNSFYISELIESVKEDLLKNECENEADAVSAFLGNITMYCGDFNEKENEKDFDKLLELEGKELSDIHPDTLIWNLANGDDSVLVCIY